MTARGFIALVSTAAIVAAAFATRSFGQQPSIPSASLQASAKYVGGPGARSVDELVRAALANNLEIVAMRKEAEAGEQLVRQARLRPNPSLEVKGTQQAGGMGDSSRMIEGSWPLELGGRRSARIRVAERELEIRRLALAERERQLAAEVRSKFGESLAAVFKLQFVEHMLATAEQDLALVKARVDEGRRPPLEQNMETVELNRIRAERERSEGAVEARMFELRNLAGMRPEEPLTLVGGLDTLAANVPPQVGAEQRAMQTRPDLLGAVAVEGLSAARVEQARSEGRIDAEVMLGYQRMRTTYPLADMENASGAMRPIAERMNFFTFGVRLNLPVRDRNQGMIAAAQLEAEAARNRREFGELTVRREVAAAYARYDRAFRSMQIYRVGARDRAEQNLDVVRQTYELGSKTLLDYIAEHHRYIEIENGFVDAQLEAYLAIVEILKVTNDPNLK